MAPPSFFGLYCFAQRFVERVREKLGEIDPGLFSAPGKTGRDRQVLADGFFSHGDHPCVDEHDGLVGLRMDAAEVGGLGDGFALILHERQIPGKNILRHIHRFFLIVPAAQAPREVGKRYGDSIVGVVEDRREDVVVRFFCAHRYVLSGRQELKDSRLPEYAPVGSDGEVLFGVRNGNLAGPRRVLEVVMAASCTDVVPTCRRNFFDCPL